MDRVDAVVIGAGAVGLAVARALARTGRETIVAEAQTAIGQGVSSRNSEVIHAGLYYASSATHAGGGVCGIPGMQAARAALHDARAARWSPRAWLSARRA